VEQAASDWSFGNELFRGLVCGLLEQARQAAPQVKLWKWMQAHQASLFVFEDVEGVEPTNNVSERALRGAVAWRKRSQGVQSERGGEFVAGMMSVRESLSKQLRNPFTFLIDLHRSHALGLPQPSLLPLA
jgi:transposase